MTILKDLLKRRVPQIVGIYLASSWAIIEFLDWLINQFSISPHISEFGLITLVSMIPTVLLLAYFHGKPGRDTWTKIEKVGIPVNVLGVLLLLIFVFKGTDLGATTTLVHLENEEGQIIERIIPKPEFRKKIMLYFMNNESGDSTLNWLCYGITDMLSTDLMQDYYVEAQDISYSPASRERLNKTGYTSMSGLPLMLEKEIADDLHLDYFLTGSFTKQNDSYSVNVNLYQTRNGRLISQYTLDNTSIMDLVDQMTVQLKKDLKVPSYHMEEVDDLPVSEISTSSLKAYEWYIKGTTERIFNNDLRTAQEYLSNAVMEDPTFSLAYYMLYIVYMNNNQSDKGAILFEPLMNHLYKLPEKMQFIAKASYYEFKHEYDKQYAVFEMMVTLFPEDIQTRLNLIALYKIRNQIDEAIAAYKHILELDPQRHFILIEIGSLYKQKGKYEDALLYYRRYSDLFPDKPESYRLMGEVYKTSGDLEEAKFNFDRALLLEPGNISDIIQLADIESRTGHFIRALTQYHKALDISSNSREKAMVYERLQSFHKIRGEKKKALEYLYLKEKEWKKMLIPLRVTTLKIRSFDQFVKLEREDIVHEALETLRTELDPLLKEFISIGYMYWYLEEEDVENAETEIVRVENMIYEFGAEVLQTIPLAARGRVHEILGEYDLAIQKYRDQLEIEPTNTGIYKALGRCNRKLKNFEKAEEALQKALKVNPFSPEANYEMALVYHETGNSEMAFTHLNRVMTIWENADSDYEPAIIAREKLAERNQ